MTKRNAFYIAIVLVIIIGSFSYMSKEADKNSTSLPQVGLNANATTGS